MKVKIRFFAEFRRLTGADQIECELGPAATVGDAVEAARARFPVLRQFERSTLVAKGLEFAEPGQPVRDGDEIALMPPVMGG